MEEAFPTIDSTQPAPLKHPRVHKVLEFGDGEKYMTQRYKLKCWKLLRAYQHLLLPEAVMIHSISWALACNFYLLRIWLEKKKNQ